MKNVTIAINEEIEQFARSLAAKSSKSLSRFIADLLTDLKMQTEKRNYALEEYFTIEPYLETAGKSLSRDEIYDRKVLR